MKVYESSTNTDDTLLASFYKRGITLYKDGSRLGMIGTNNIIGNESVKGIVFDLNYSGSYMAWASKDVNDDVNEYTIKLAYVGKGRGFENHEEDALYSTVTLDMRNHYLKNPIFKIGDDIGKNLTFNFYQCTSVTNNKGNFPTTPCYLRFKHGLMVDAKVFQIT